MGKVSETLMILDDSVIFLLAMAVGLLFAIGGIYLVYVWQPIGILFVLAGALVLVAAKKTTIRLDKGSGQMAVERFSLFGSKRTETPLKKISKVTLQQAYRGKAPVELSFFLSDGFALSYSNITGDIGEASLVAQFLHVPFEAKGPPTSAQVSGEIRDRVAYLQQKAKGQNDVE